MTTTPDLVEYDDASHTYRVNGEEYPSVSTVLNMFCNFDRVPPHTLEYKRKLGKATHKAIELFEEGELDEESLDETVAAYFAGWIKFRTDRPLEVVDAERIVYSTKHRYAGRLDLVVRYYGQDDLELLDVKCVDRMAPETALQTSGYAEAYPQKVKTRAGLQLRPDGTYRYFPYPDKTDFLVFLNALNLFRWLNNRR